MRPLLPFSSLFRALTLCAAAFCSAAASGQADIPVADGILTNASTGQRELHSASSGSEVLMVWLESTPFWPPTVVGTRLNAAGESLDEANLKFEAGPNVLWTGDGYVVFDTKNFQRVSREGKVFPAQPNPTAFAPGSAPEIIASAYAADHILILYRTGNHRTICIYDHSFRVVRTVEADQQYFINVGSVGDRFALFTSTWIGRTVIEVLILDPEGTIVARRDLSQYITYALDAVASGGGTTIAMGRNSSNGVTTAVVIGAGGEIVSDYEFPSDTVNRLASVAWDGSDYFAIVAADYTDNSRDGTYYATLPRNGGLAVVSPTPLSRVSSLLATAGVGGARFGFMTVNHITSYRLGVDAPAASTVFTLGTSAAPQHNAVMARTGELTLIAWLERRTRGGGVDLYARRVLSNGIPLDVEPRRIAQNVCPGVWPAVAATSDKFLVAWTTMGTTEAVRMDRDGRILESEPLLIQRETSLCNSAVTAAGSAAQFAIAWRNGSTNTIQVRLVSDGGTMRPPQTIVSAESGLGRTGELTSASDGKSFVFAFDLYDRAGARLSVVDDLGIVRHSNGTGAGVDFLNAIGWDGSQYVVLGRRSVNGTTVGVVNRVTESGTSIDVTGTATPSTLPVTHLGRMFCEAGGCAVASSGGGASLIVSRVITAGAAPRFETVRDEPMNSFQQPIPFDGDGTRVLLLRARSAAPWGGAWRLFIHDMFASSRRRSAH